MPVKTAKLTIVQMTAYFQTFVSARYYTDLIRVGSFIFFKLQGIFDRLKVAGVVRVLLASRRLFED